MKCKNCNIVLENENITAEFLNPDTIDLVITCPKCSKRFYTFVEKKDMIED